MKPHIKKVNGMWRCYLNGVFAVGETPLQSYWIIMERELRLVIGS